MSKPPLNNRYEIIKTLGRGGFGETFLAVDTHMPSARQCVIKQLKPILEKPEIPTWLQERFQREAAILEELGENHSQIPKLYAYFSEAGNFYLVQEWIEGLTLTQQCQRQGKFSSEDVQNLLVNLLPVLDFVHQHRIIHRDIKPDNIILRTRDGKPTLIDFGIIKETMETVVNPDGKSAYSVAIGTPGYMASEQAAGRPVYASDLYSLGLTAIFLLTGKTPQYLDHDPHSGEILWRQEAPHVSPALAGILERCIPFNPRDRFGSAREMLAALNQSAALEDRTAATVVVSPKGQTSTRPPRPRKTIPLMKTERELDTEVSEPASSPWITWLVMPLLFLGIIVAGLTAGFWFATKHRRPAPRPEVTETPVISPTPEQSATPEIIRTPRPKSTFSPSPTPSPLPSETPSPSPLPTESLPPLSSPEPELSPMIPVETPTPETPPTIIPSPSPMPSETIPTSLELEPTPTPPPTINIPVEPPAPPLSEKPVN